MNGFKTTLCLHHIFDDHRGLSRIFVNTQKFLTIKNLEDHIARTFNIENFYLQVDGKFLPSGESIHILCPNESIVAIPFENNTEPKSSECVNNTIDAPEQIEEIINNKRKEKKDHKSIKKLKTSKIPDPIQTSTPKDENDSHRIVFNDIEHHQTNKTKDTENRSNSVDGIVENSIDSLASTPLISGQSASNTPMDTEETEMDVNISNLMKKHKLFVRSHNTSNICLELPRNHNIVKSIIISNGVPNVSQVETNIAENKDKPDSSKEINILQDIVISPKKITTTKPNIPNDCQLNPIEEEHTAVLAEGSTTKRKRIRTRKRKSKQVKLEEEVVPNFDFKTNLPKPNPSTHIVFEDSDGDNVESTEVVEKKNDVEKELSDEQTTTFEMIKMTVDTPSINTNEITKTELENTLSYGNYSSDVISKFPLITDAVPEVGSVIAFKTLKLGDNFAPEFTDYIVGKVVNKSIDDKFVSLYILAGVDEAKNAVNSISTLVEGENTETLTFEWRHMLDPRLTR